MKKILKKYWPILVFVLLLFVIVYFFLFCENGSVWVKWSNFKINWITIFYEVFSNPTKWGGLGAISQTTPNLLAIFLYYLSNRNRRKKKEDSIEIIEDRLGKKKFWKYVILGNIGYFVVSILTLTTFETCKLIKAHQQFDNANVFLESPFTNYEDISGLPQCNFNDKNIQYPCIYSTIINDTFFKIADKACYGNDIKAGLIAELYRNESGKIPTLVPNALIIIPDPNPDYPRNADYYTYYFGLYDFSLPECGPEPFSFPCWYKVKDEQNYENLATKYTSFNVLDCIKAANDTKYSMLPKEQLIPKDLAEGTIVVLPNCD